jgi:hypothetical protein
MFAHETTTPTTNQFLFGNPKLPVASTSATALRYGSSL